MLDHLGKHLNLGVVELVFGIALSDLGDQHLGAVVLDIGLVSSSSSTASLQAG